MIELILKGLLILCLSMAILGPLMGALVMLVVVLLFCLVFCLVVGPNSSDSVDGSGW